MDVIDHPEIAFVVPRVKLDGSASGLSVTMRHDLDCGHFKYPDGSSLGTPVRATEEQMSTLPACKDCIAKVKDRHRTVSVDGVRTGGICPTCFVAMPVAGNCEYCD